MTSGPYGPVQGENGALVASIRAALSLAEPDVTIPIGVIGCGWIAGLQLDAYRRMGVNVVALADRHPERALAYRDEYFPQARAYASTAELLAHPGLRVADIATHLDGRPETVLECLRAGKHVLSQKPFVEDIATGHRLMAAAADAGVVLAVNQNGRWAPHFGAMLAVVSAGIIGDVISADFQVEWPHDLLVEDKPAFAAMDDLILFDFGAHWFDLVGLLAPVGPLHVHAITGHRPGQSIRAPTQANALVSGPEFVASLGFRAGERFAEHGGYRISGSKGVIYQSGRCLGGSRVSVETAAGTATIATHEDWFRHGLAGAMRALLVAVSAADLATADLASAAPAAAPAAAGGPATGVSSLRGLELVFAALESARTATRVTTGQASRRAGTASGNR